MKLLLSCCWMKFFSPLQVRLCNEHKSHSFGGFVCVLLLLFFWHGKMRMLKKTAGSAPSSSGGNNLIDSSCSLGAIPLSLFWLTCIWYREKPRQFTLERCRKVQHLQYVTNSLWWENFALSLLIFKELYKPYIRCFPHPFIPSLIPEKTVCLLPYFKWCNMSYWDKN